MMKPTRQRCYLVCNAHLDPVWLWPWEDGMAEAIATFRVAADFCDEFPEFVFNHNEALLYEWVERNEPALFARIRKLVRKGRWHPAGGAFLQPDLIAASGESIIRQYLAGKAYFDVKFGIEPTTAYNFDSFGHPRGLIQILAGCGFNAYIFCRPDRRQLDLPVGSFRWRHPSGVEIVARRSDEHYITQGEIRRKMQDGNWEEHYREEGDYLFLWGIGNHGGGPSRAEYAQFAAIRAEHPAVEFVESNPDAFFKRSLARRGVANLPVYAGDFKPVWEGCYTSMQRIKSAHRRAENLMRLTETLAALAWRAGRRPYPAADLTVAWKDILFSEFHDILPGSAVPSVEEDSLQLLGHCEEILRRNRAASHIALLRSEPPAERNQTPLFVFNPHAWPVTRTVEIEYCLDRQYAPDSVVRHVLQDGKPVPAQFERGENNLDDPGWGEWRVRAVFDATVPPCSYARFATDYEVLPMDRVRRWQTPPLPRGKTLRLVTSCLDVAIDLKSGLLAHVRQDGRTILGKESGRPLVFHDGMHSWETQPEWRAPDSAFRLATPKEAARVKGQPAAGATTGNSPIAIIEDGPVRTTVEAILVHGHSYIVQRYTVSKTRPELTLDQTVFWAETDRMLMLQFLHGRGFNQVRAERCYSIDDAGTALGQPGRVQDFQHFLRLGTAADDAAFAAVSHGIHGFSRRPGELRVSVLRSPAYACMAIAPDCQRFRNRYMPRQDQGLRQSRLTFVFGETARDVSALTRAAWECNVPLDPFIYFPTTPPGTVTARMPPPVRVSAASVLVMALKKSDRGEDLVLRFWETAGRDTAFNLTLDGKRHRLRIGAHRLLTVRVTAGGALTETDLLERPLRPVKRAARCGEIERNQHHQ